MRPPGDLWGYLGVGDLSIPFGFFCLSISEESKSEANVSDEEIRVESDHAKVAELINSTPPFEMMGKEEYQWLARARQFLQQYLTYGEMAQVAGADRGICNTLTFQSSMHVYQTFLHTIQARLEEKLPSESRGSYLPVASAMDVFSAFSQLFSEASADILVVDPYLDHQSLQGIFKTVPEGVRLRLLADSAYPRLNETLNVAVAAWQKQYGQTRPIEVRFAEAKALHDRLIFIDGTSAWVCTQSLKDFAIRSPASLTKAGEEATKMKIDHYFSLWEQASKDA